MSTEDKLIAVERSIADIRKDIDYIQSKVDDLTDMKSVLVELKTISAYQVKRMDTFENSLKSLAESVDEYKSEGSISYTEIIKYILFTALGVAVTAISSVILIK